MSEIKVNSIKGVGASSAAITVNNTDGTCTANITNNLSNRNLIINGAMQVAQRGTSSTADGYGSVDRFKCNLSGNDENATHEQADVASGTTPYTLGFRKCFKITNGNQTSGAGAGDIVEFGQKIEAQNIANSGWNYTSASSFITLSFWVKSSVAQVFYGYLRTRDGTSYSYPFSTGSLSANTWTKVTKTIPGNSNLQIDNNNDSGFEIYFDPFLGTTYTNDSRSLDSWAAHADASHFPDMTSTWYTTNDATFEITGVQLEVGSVATDFEHRSFAVEKRLCKRYYEELKPKLYILARYSHHDGAPYGQYHFNVEKRAAPTCSIDTTGGTFESSTGYSGNPSFTDTTVDSTTIYGANSVTAGGILYLHTSSSGLLKFDAEL
jgi:hypothetical protein